MNANEYLFLPIKTEPLEKALETWGKAAQMFMALEECGEFITALTQHWRGRNVDVVQEIADVIILMVQMRLIFGSEAVDKIIQQKMERLDKRLERKDINGC